MDSPEPPRMREAGASRCPDDSHWALSRLEVDHARGVVITRNERVQAPPDHQLGCTPRDQQRSRLHPPVGRCDGPCGCTFCKLLGSLTDIEVLHRAIDHAEHLREGCPRPTLLQHDLLIEASGALIPQKGKVTGT